ncbi:stage V sporulation protein AA [Scopulibacillus darangshiensis]|uniref:Stage V sporulation protein AA n=1 Tax=Scopulibacillus darangshiensis TaxID=442528 RepID=A0A4R2P9W9_9BACL|nr:stage V sporulation protein AA [Scopulibacillus darangshiensis]TCP31727.1 stage V sporulation protein AA [Scopulibacillus darangshiensis]
MSSIVLYIRLRQKFQAKMNEIISIEKLAHLIGPKDMTTGLKQKPIYKVKPEDNAFIVIDVMDIIAAIYKEYPDVDIQTVGPSQTIIEVQPKKRKINTLFFVIVWILLFIGAGLTIMNFHEDVAMRSVHQKIYYLITGTHNDKPLILQIPYSFGLGLGMILFFNHIFKKKFNEEPSPLEVEMFNYQQDLDQYVIVHEKKKSELKRHDD